MSLAGQPPELLDAIASFVPLLSDLLSLALSSRVLHGIIVPSHLEFRHVCCDARRTTLWKALLERPGVSSRIMSLGLHPEDHQKLIPQSLNAENAEDVNGNGAHDCAEALSTAIATMSSLERFSFHQTSFAAAHKTKPIFEALRRYCPNLRDVEITFQDGNSFEAFSAPLWQFANLTRVSVTVNRHVGVRGIPRPFLKHLFAMLSHCPQLQDLRVASEMRGPNADISGFLTSTWPALRRFIVEGDLSLAYTKKLSSFLLRHPSLEALLLPSARNLPLLPNLRWLGPCPEGDTAAIDVAQQPRLEYLAMVSVYWRYINVARTLNVLRALPSLRGVTAAFPTVAALQQLAEALPNLERLTLAHSPWNLNRVEYPRPQENRIPSPECLGILTSFKHLTHLDTSVSIKRDEAVLDELFRALSVAPKLEYIGVDLQFDDPRTLACPLTWFKVVRDVHGGYVGRTEVRDARKVRFHDWDDVFREIGVGI
ncbi:hypothetical protein C8R46DRAFT_1356375 [Mycena filopes]|nr:hypothetical protein C8R46DRAFT_1356375 [Mycena filopes]